MGKQYEVRLVTAGWSSSEDYPEAPIHWAGTVEELVEATISNQTLIEPGTPYGIVVQEMRDGAPFGLPQAFTGWMREEYRKTETRFGDDFERLYTITTQGATTDVMYYEQGVLVSARTYDTRHDFPVLQHLQLLLVENDYERRPEAI